MNLFNVSNNPAWNLHLTNEEEKDGDKPRAHNKNLEEPGFNPVPL